MNHERRISGAAAKSPHAVTHCYILLLSLSLSLSTRPSFSATLSGKKVPATSRLFSSADRKTKGKKQKRSAAGAPAEMKTLITDAEVLDECLRDSVAQ